MEYRIHTSNGLRLSVLGINIFNSYSNKKKINPLEINEILNELKSRKINFINIPYIDDHLIKEILEWEKKNDFSFVKSIELGLPRNDDNSLLFSDNREEIIQNRFQNIEDQIESIFNLFAPQKFEFLTLFYPKLTHFNQNNLNSLIEKVKNTYSINSFGIHCQYLSDALLICKHSNINHIEIELEINSSIELINAIFKIVTDKNISVFCSLNDDLKNFKNSNYESTDSLATLLKAGNIVLEDKISFNFNLKTNEIILLSIMKYLENDFQSVLVPFPDLELLKKYFNCLSKPYLTNDEKNILKNILERQLYDSPKNKLT